MAAQPRKGREVDGVAGGPRNLLAFQPSTEHLGGVASSRDWSQSSREHSTRLWGGGGEYTHVDRGAEVILKVEMQINRRPLTNVEDDVELPLLTPQTFLYQRSTQLPEQPTHQINDLHLRSPPST